MALPLAVLSPPLEWQSGSAIPAELCLVSRRPAARAALRRDGVRPLRGTPASPYQPAGERVRAGLAGGGALEPGGSVHHWLPAFVSGGGDLVLGAGSLA